MVGFIGAAGNMAGAIIDGILNNKTINENQLYLFDLNLEGLKKYTASKVNVVSSVSELTSSCKYVFVCSKPQGMSLLLGELKKHLKPDQCVVSIAAGVTTKTIESYFEFNCKVVRTIPNTPLLLSLGATGICKNEFASQEDLEFVQDIFSSCGVSVLCEESQMNTVTAISGSGPAYVFKFAKAVMQAADELGFDSGDALTLFSQTLFGSAKMLVDSGMTPTELIKMVTSPNGTTQAANESFDSNDFEGIVVKAVKAAKNRGDELSKS